mgnify:CR=1 FL=1|jgi:clan AA aspartic protease
MNGRVSAHHAFIELTFRFPGDLNVNLQFAVDTGFVGYLTLPPAVIGAMNLPFLRRVTANLADDSTIHVSVYMATILWDSQEHQVEVLAIGARPLLGTLLLDGYELNVQFIEGGLVSVEAL